MYYLNVGSEEEISIKKLAELIAKITEFNGDILWDKGRPDGTLRKNLDSSRIKSLGWKPEIKLESGIKCLIKEINSELDQSNGEFKNLKNF